MKYRSGQILRTVAYSIGNQPWMYHFGIIWIDDKTGEKFVLHNSLDKGVIKSPWENFFRQRTIDEVQDSKLELLSNEEIMLRFEECKGSFNWMKYNCEHFVDCMLREKQVSEQLVNYVLFASVLYLIFTK